MSTTSVPAGALGLWLCLEEEIRRGDSPDPRHVAEALRQGIPIALSPELQRYIAELIPPPKRLRGRRKLSAGECAVRNRRLVDRYDELAAQYRGLGLPKRGERKWVLAEMAREHGHSVEKQYDEASKGVGPRSEAPPGQPKTL